MRTPRRFIFVIVALLLAYTITPRARLLWESLSAPDDDSPVSRARQVTTFVLREEAWIEFEIPSQAESLQIVTVANLNGSTHGSVEDIWEYSIKYNLRDSQGTALLESVSHFRSGYTEYVEPRSGNLEPGAFYVGLPQRPLDGRRMMLKLTDAARGGVLSLRAIPGPEDIEDVMVRVYSKKRTEEPPSRFAWRSLTERSRKRLAAGNVYSSDLLTQSEKTNILWNLNERVAPRGVPGKDFVVRKLYILEERGEEDSVAPNVVPAGLIVHPHLHGIVPVPAGVGTIRFDFKSLFSVSPMSETAPIRLLYYGKNLQERRTYRIASNDSSFEMEDDWDGGLFEVVPPSVGTVRAYHMIGDATVEITPDPDYLRAYRLSDGERVEFDVLHEGGEETPMRMDVRIPLSVDWIKDATPSAWMRYEFVDSTGKAFEDAVLNVESPPSIFDRLSDTETYPSISEKRSFYFLLAEKVAGIRIASITGTALVAMYNRPRTLARVTSVPESSAFSAEDRPAERTWFYLPPMDVDGLVEENRTQSIAIQKRPPNVNEYIESGDYSWESLKPDTTWKGRELLIPRSAETIQKHVAPPSVYREIQAGVPQDLSFVSSLGDSKSKPSLIILREEAEPVSVEVSIGDVPRYRGDIAVRLAEIDLPPLPVGEHRVLVRLSRKARLLVNRVHLAEGTVYQRLTALSVEDKAMPFLYSKRTEGNDGLTGRFFVPRDTRERTVLEFTLQARRTAEQPFDALTIENRLFHIRPSSENTVYALYSKKMVLGEGQRFFVQLGADLPVGDYRFVIRKRSGPSGYLLLTRIAPGLQQKRHFFWESSWRDES